MHSSPAKVGITQITPPCYLLAQLSEGGGQDGASFVYSGIVYGNRLALFGNKYGRHHGPRTAGPAGEAWRHSVEGLENKGQPGYQTRHS